MTSHINVAIVAHELIEISNKKFDLFYKKYSSERSTFTCQEK